MWGKKGMGGWDPLVCLGWGDRFIEFMKGVVVGANEVDPPSTDSPDKDKNPTHRVWRVSFKPNDGVSVRVLDEEEVDDVRGGEDRVGFLPTAFVVGLQEKKKGGGEGGADVPREQVPHGVEKRSNIPTGWQI